MMLKWFSQNCEDVSYLLKTDDDMYINLHKLHDLASFYKKERLSDTLVGSLVCTSLPVRDSNNKWYMAKEIYQERRYPSYLHGGASYLMSKSAAKKLYANSMETPINHIEDLYVTGVLSAKSNIRYHCQSYAQSSYFKIGYTFSYF